MIRRLIPATAVLALAAACGTGGGAVAVQTPSNSDTIVVSSSGSAPPPVVSSTGVTSDSHSGGRTAPLPRPGASEQLWLIRGAKLWPTTRTQPRHPSAPLFLLRALGRSPTAAERAAGLSTAVSPKAVLGVGIVRGVAIVHLRPGFGGTPATRRLERAQIVFTLTGLRAVHSVQLAVTGQDISPPQTRFTMRTALPPVVITSPAPGGVVGPRTTIEGITPARPEDVQIRLLDAAGIPIISGDSSSGCSRACLGTFSLSVDQLESPRSGPGAIEVIVHPAGGGQPITLREPVLLRPTFDVLSPGEGATLTSPASVAFYSGLPHGGPLRVALYDATFHLLAKQIVRPPTRSPCPPNVQCQLAGAATVRFAFRVAGIQPGYLVFTPLPGSGGDQHDILEVPVTLNGG
jgi:Sporulation and spore germination